MTRIAMAQPDAALPFYSFARHFPIRVRPASPLDDDELFELCARNRDLRIERSVEGDLVITSPTGGETSRRNAAIVTALGTWAANDGTGVVFDSSGGFVLPNGAERAPDASWISRERLDALTPGQRERFPPLCPDFVVELRSQSDALGDLQAKMREYVVNGARLGWLIEPDARRVWIFEPMREPECLEGAARVGGGGVLPGFVLELAPIW